MVYLSDHEVSLETIKLIKDFFREKRESCPVYQSQNNLDNEFTFPIGAYKGRKPMDISVPLKYVKWWFAQKKMSANILILKSVFISSKYISRIFFSFLS